MHVTHTSTQSKATILVLKDSSSVCFSELRKLNPQTIKHENCYLDMNKLVHFYLRNEHPSVSLTKQLLLDWPLHKLQVWFAHQISTPLSELVIQ